MGKRGPGAIPTSLSLLLVLLIICSPFTVADEAPIIDETSQISSPIIGSWGKVIVGSQDHHAQEQVALHSGLLQRTLRTFSFIRPVEAQVGGCCFTETGWCQTISEDACCGMSCASGLYEPGVPCHQTDCVQQWGCCLHDCNFITKEQCGYPGDITVFRPEENCEQVYECVTGVCASSGHCVEGAARKDCPETSNQHFYPGMTISQVAECLGGTASTGTLTGVVRDQDGAPVSGVTVTILTGLSKFAVTDTNGAYTITSVLIGTYRVTASKSPYPTVTEDAVLIEQDQVTTLDFVISTDAAVTTGTVRGVVYDQLVTVPLPGAYVFYSDMGRTVSAYADVNGAYVLSGVPSGTVRITASSPGYDWSVRESVVVPAGGEVTGQDFILMRAAGGGTCGNGVIDPGETCDIGWDLEPGTSDDVDAACPGYCRSDCRCPTSCGEVQGFTGEHLCYLEDFQCTDVGGSYIPVFSTLILPAAPTPPFDDLIGDWVQGIPSSEASVGCCDIPCHQVPDCLMDRSIASSYDYTGDYCTCGSYYFKTSGNPYYCCQMSSGQSQFSPYTCDNIVFLTGFVRDSETDQPILAARVYLYDGTELLASVPVGPSGNYSFQVIRGRTYRIVAEAGFNYSEYAADYTVPTGTASVTHDIYLTKTDRCILETIAAPVLELTNIMGSPSLSVRWRQDCSHVVTRYDIYRRVSGTGDFTLLRSFTDPSIGYFLDEATAWNTTYEYRVDVHSALTGSASSEVMSIYTGHPMCEGKTSSSIEFCLDAAYNVTGEMVYRMVCDTTNTPKFIHNGQIGHEYGNCTVYGQAVMNAPAYCRYTSATTTVCSLQDQCEYLGLGVPSGIVGQNIFGLYYDRDYANSTYSLYNCTHSRVGSGTLTPRFCYYDHSDTTIDLCTSCKTRGSCFDYLSEEACISDNCGYGQKLGTSCEYHRSLEYFQEMGKGVCYPVGYSNVDKCTAFCGDAAPDFFRNNGCTEELCSKLGACFSDDGRCNACTTASSCASYTSEEACTGGQPFIIPSGCGSSSDMIPSQDSCALGTCYWDGSVCIKDADSDRVDDCESTISPMICNSDNSPPITSITYLPPFINILGDSVNFTVVDIGFEPVGMTTYYCVSEGGCCPTESVSHDGQVGIFLSNETDGLAYMEGVMLVQFYSKDRHNNVEKIGSTQILVDTIPPGFSDFSYAVSNFSRTSQTSRVDVQISIIDSKNYTYCNFSLVGGPSELSLKYERYVTLESQALHIPFTNAGGSDPGIPDGHYLFAATCKDTTNNYASFQENIYVNRLNEIYFIQPNTTISGDFFFYSLRASDNYEFCVVAADAGEVRLNRDIMDSYHFRSAAVPTYGSGTYTFPIHCYESSADHAAGNPSASSSVLFSIDNDPPETTWRRQSGAMYYDLEPGRTYGEITIRAFCVDPDIHVGGLDVHYPPLGEFGCENTYTCSTDVACSIQDCREGPFGTEREYALTGTGTTCICSYSVDKGGNQEDITCFSISTDNNDPSVQITSPYNNFATTLSYQQIEFIWANIVPPAQVYLTWRAEDMIRYRSVNATISDMAGASSLIMDSLFEGPNYVELAVYDQTYTGGTQGVSRTNITIYYDTIGPNISNAKIMNSEGKRIDNETANPEVAGFNTPITFTMDADDIFYRDPLKQRTDDISRAYLEIYPPSSSSARGTYEMISTGGSEYTFTFDPETDGYLFSGEHVVVYSALDSAYNPNGEYNVGTYAQSFVLNETTEFIIQIFNDQGRRIDTGSFSEFGTPIMINGSVSNPAYITHIDVGVVCIEACISNYSAAFTMERDSPAGGTFTLMLSPEQLPDGSYSLMPGLYRARFSLANMDGMNDIFESSFLIKDTVKPTFNITIDTPHMNDGLQVITSGKDGTVLYYDVYVNASEPVNITEFLFEVYRPSTRALALETFMSPVITNNWMFRIAIPLTDSFYEGLSGNNSRFALKAVDLSGNAATSSDILTGRYFEVDTFGGNRPILSPDIPNMTIFTQTGIEIVGHTDPREENVTLTIGLSALESTHMSGLNGTFSANKHLQTLGTNDLFITPRDYLDNVGGTTMRVLIFDDTGLVFIATDPLDGETLSAVQTIRAILYDGESGVNLSSINMLVNGLPVSISKTVYEEFYVDIRHNRRLTDGNYTVFINGTNNAGIEANTTFSFVVDSTVPDKPAFSVVDGAYHDTPHRKWYIDQDSFAFTLGFLPSSSSFEIINASIVQDPTAQVTCTGSGSAHTCQVAGPLADGTYTVKVVAHRLLAPGRYGSPGTYEYLVVVDTTAPELNLSDLVIYTNDQEVTVAGSYLGLDEDDVITLSGDVVSPVNVTLDPRRKTFNGTVTLDASAEGNYTIFVTATDKAGNQVTVPLTVSYDLSAGVPTGISVTSDGSNVIRVNDTYFITNAGTERWALNISGTAEPGTIEVWKSHETSSGVSSEYLETTITVGDDGSFDIPITLGQADGENYFRIISTDRAGNTATYRLTILSDTTGANLTGIQMHLGELPVALIGSTRSQLGILGPTLAECDDDFIFGTIAYDSCLINRALAGDDGACDRIVNVFLKRSCKINLS